MTDVKAQSEDRENDQPHPSTFSPATFALLIVLAIFGAIIGIQLILQLGVTPNTSIIGALVAMILARIPLTLLVTAPFTSRTSHRATFRPQHLVRPTASLYQSVSRFFLAAATSYCRCWSARHWRCCSMRICSTGCLTPKSFPRRAHGHRE